MSSILNINSDFRTTTSISPSNFEINLGQALNIKEVVIKNITIPNTVYNVTELNNLFAWQDSTLHQLSIPIGNYDITSLMETIRILSSDAFSWLLNPASGKVELTFSLVSRIYCDGIGQLIGLQGQTGTYPDTFRFNIILKYVPNLTAVRNFYVCSRTLGQGVNSILVNGANLPIIAILPNNVSFGGINQYLSNDSLLELKVFSAQQNLQYIDIQIRGDNGQILDFNGSSFQMNVLIYKTANNTFTK